MEAPTPNQCVSCESWENRGEVRQGKDNGFCKGYKSIFPRNNKSPSMLGKLVTKGLFLYLKNLDPHQRNYVKMMHFSMDSGGSLEGEVFLKRPSATKCS